MRVGAGRPDNSEAPDDDEGSSIYLVHTFLVGRQFYPFAVVPHRAAGRG